MSIEDLEKIRETFKDRNNYDMLRIGLFMEYTIDLFKDLITDLQQFNKELAKKENAIDVNNIKIGETD